MKQKNSVYRKWIFSYFILLCFSAVLNFVLYYYNLGVVRTEVIHSNQQALESMQKDINNIFSDADKLITQISGNAAVNKLLNNEYASEKEARFAMYNLTKDLTDMQKNNYYISNLYLYVKSSDTVISPSAIGKKDYMLKNDLQLSTESLNELSSLLSTASEAHTFLAETTKNNSKNELLILTQSLPLVSKYSAGTIIIAIDKSQLISSLNQHIESNFYIIDRNENILPVWVNEDINLDDFSLNSSNSVQYINGMQMHVIRTEATKNNWSYISLLPDRVITSRLFGIKVFFYIFLAVCLILGALISLALLNYNYKPFQELLKVISKRSDNPYNNSVSEYTFIENIIEKISSEKNQLNLYIKKQDNILKQNFINRMLSEGIETDSAELLKKYKIDVVSDNVVAGVIHFKDLSELFGDEKLNEKEIFDSAVLIVSNVLEELLSKENSVFFTVIDNAVAFGIIIRPENEKNIFSQIESAVDFSQNFIYENFGFEFYTALSNIHSFSDGINLAYREALSCMEYKTETNEQILFYHRLNAERHTGYFYSFTQEKQLINLIKTNNLPEAERMFENILCDFKKRSFMSAGLLRFLIYDIAGTLFKALQDIYCADSSSVPDDMLTVIDRLLICQTTTELKEALKPLLAYTCTLSSQKASTPVVETVKNYINENYPNSSLSVSSIAEEVGKHPNYLSMLFKEQTGANILEHLTAVRLENAKRLLSETNFTIEQIAQKVGYTNAHTFTRIFKREEGVTPTQFRKM